MRNTRLQKRKAIPLPGPLTPRDETEAYMVQSFLQKNLATEGFGNVVGHKIGCTTPVMQNYLGITSPCSGGIYDSMTYDREGVYNFQDLIHPGVECEIAVRIGSDILCSSAPYDLASLKTKIDCVMASIEVVDDRWDDYKTIGTPSLIADDFFGLGAVFGSPVMLYGLDLTKICGFMTVNGNPVGSGRGSDIMGHPLNALTWLANSLAARGLDIRAGAYVSLGSIVQTVWVNKSDVVAIDIMKLGKAEARFE